MLNGATLCRMTTNGKDWALVAALIHEEAPRRLLTISQLAKAAGVDRAFVPRLAKGEGVKPSTLARAEMALGLPRGLLRYVAEHDLDAVREAGGSPDLVIWLTKRIAASTQEPGHNSDSA